ncbi:MAG: tRNA (guanine(6)-N2)-methyltransferase [Nitrososphaerota archaeon]
MEYFEWFATTISGLEDLAAREIEELTGLPTQPDVGKVFFEGTIEHAAKINYSSTMVNKVYLLLEREEIQTLEDLYNVARRLDYSWLIEPNQTFAVKAERHDKKLPFTSINAAASIGRAIIESFAESTKIKLRVDLDNPDLEFYCLLRDSKMFLGLNTTGESLHKRYYKAYSHRAGLQSTIASAMIKISGWGKNQSLLDPMCGGGTIPIEAAIKLKNIPPGFMRRELDIEKLKFVDSLFIQELRKKIEESIDRDALAEIVGSDVSPKSAEYAKRNVEAAGVSDTVRIEVRDCLKISEWLNWEPSHVITNPPYGVRMNIGNIVEFYSRFIENIRRASPNSRLTVIVSKPKTLTSILRENNYRIVSTREIMYGRLRTVIISAEG